MSDPEFANPAPDDHDDSAHRGPDPVPDEATCDVPLPNPEVTLPPDLVANFPHAQDYPTQTYPFDPSEGGPEITATLLPPFYHLPPEELTGTLDTQPAPLIPPSGPLTGRIGGYQLLQFLGRGGYNSVFRARHRQLGIAVALKISHYTRESLPLPDEVAGALAHLGRLRHPNLVATYGTGIHGNHPFMVTELIDGPTLHGFCQREPRPDPALLLTLLAQVARGVAYLHRNGIIHRDIKPSNILIDGRGQARLTDYGLATLWPLPEQMYQRAVVGTPAFMAPEQIQGNRTELGPATDIWGLGSTLYWVLTGAPPFRRDGIGEIFQAILQEDCPSLRAHWPEAPLALDRICQRCLQRNPAHRYTTAGDLADDLVAFLEGRLAEPEPIRSVRWWEFWRRA